MTRVGILDPDSFLDREIARLTAALVETTGGLRERSKGGRGLVPGVMDDREALSFITGLGLFRLTLPSSRIEEYRSSSEAERLILEGAVPEPDHAFVKS